MAAKRSRSLLQNSIGGSGKSYRLAMPWPTYIPLDARRRRASETVDLGLW